jgi:opacity protein-like surface antigen
MKKLIIAVAFAAAITSPAFAATAHPLSHRAFEAGRQSEPDAYSAQAQAQELSHSSSYDVYRHGEYVGSDPDPFIRNELWKSAASDFHGG